MKPDKRRIKIKSVGSLEKSKLKCINLFCNNPVAVKGICVWCEAKRTQKKEKEYQKLCDKKKYGLE